ncbi:hypothetical protein BD410DRAFT_398401 [Rickenella mellea]|uniref:Methyltransferase FkbM domain-containing protein n=1 Tax=Rickenella mellea TaxID=50990 RepID=A0A4Y7PXH9_9AGAM|nr:hypothetical protein BD410DRAFT_398401 [Rickenella mellea]
MYTLASLMQLNGHTHIDVLKIDIEGREFETLSSLLRTYVDADQQLSFGQLQLETHIWSKNIAPCLQWWGRQSTLGLRMSQIEVCVFAMHYDPSKA